MKTFALVDCNNFFVSCERVFSPRVQNMPTVVLSSNDGCVISRSQEIKDMGVPMGIPYFKMKGNYDLSKIATFSTNFKLYRDMSARVMAVLEEFCPKIEIYSIDEAFVDLSVIENPEKFCLDLQKKIKQYTGIPVSIGIAPTRTLAKLANVTAKESKKPVHVLKAKNEIEEILKNVSAGKIWGIGSNTLSALLRFGITNAFSLTQQSPHWIHKNFGITLLRIVNELKGESCFSISKLQEPRKSIIDSRSFEKVVSDFKTLFESISYHVANAAYQMREEGSAAKRLSVTISTNRFSNTPIYYQTKSVLFERPISDTIELTKNAREILREIYVEGLGYKKSGIMLSDLIPIDSCYEEDLFGGKVFQNEKLMKSVDTLNLAYGEGTVKLASEGMNKNWASSKKFISGEFTTDWHDMPVVSKSFL